MDLFDLTDDPTPVDDLTYQQLAGVLIWLLKLRFEIQLAVIMACSTYSRRPHESHQNLGLPKGHSGARTNLVHY
jgi:hypothetical protein